MRTGCRKPCSPVALFYFVGVSMPKIVYFAGRVAHHGGYRGKLLGDNLVMSMGHDVYEIHGGKVVYGGPFAISCDHGCFHKERGGAHGLLPVKGSECYGTMDYSEKPHDGSSCGLSKEEAVERCLDQIYSCDAVHAYIDTISCYGTLVELGYANAFGKPIYIFYDEKQGKSLTKHLWFAFHLQHVVHCGPGNETSFHSALIEPQKSYRERYHEYLKSDQWKELRLAKLIDSGDRCQLCNSPKQPLNVHHRTYDRVFNELPEDLIVLCGDCHSKFHDKLV